MDGSMRVYGVLIKLIGPISPKTDFETKLETLVWPVAANTVTLRLAALRFSYIQVLKRGRTSTS